ncbi:hypothetical protein EDB83DRAFT_1189560 [Lactarius deliciosus]|nr:hypothetical protein EDB83DRAFT_1189560 [Lactarius deliciosus]
MFSDSQQSEPPSQNAADTATTDSGPDALFSMYITRVIKLEDEKNVKNWEGGADSILIFTGLFSSTVATFIALSYPSLQQDPNITTQLLLAQISQQLSNTTIGGANSTVDPSLQISYVPPTSVVFINSVWFLSLVLSLTCAFMATLLQQWARRYIQIVQRKYAPLHYARVHEFFSGGAQKFGVSVFVESLPLILLLSVFLFFTGLVVFAFRSNHTVAYFTLSIVGICALSYIAFTLMPLFFYDCPYQTPLTPVIRFPAQRISLAILWVIYHIAILCQSWCCIFDANTVRSCKDRVEHRARSLSQTVVSRLETSGAPLSMDMCKNILVRTVRWLSEDHELEKFVNGIPGLYESEAFTNTGNDYTTRSDESANSQRNVRTILAALPGLTGSRYSLPWNIIQLAQKASASKVQTSSQKQTTRLACLRALYHIPGAICDLLALYAAGRYNVPHILPLLNSLESLEIIHELWDVQNDDVMLSVRCAAAVISAFMIDQPHDILQHYVDTDPFIIWDHDRGRQSLANRLHLDADEEGGDYDLYRDKARLRNIVQFLADVKLPLRDMYADRQWWMSDDADWTRRVRQKFPKTSSDDPRDNNSRGGDIPDQQGSRASP